MYSVQSLLMKLIPSKLDENVKANVKLKKILNHRYSKINNQKTSANLLPVLFKSRVKCLVRMKEKLISIYRVLVNVQVIRMQPGFLDIRPQVNEGDS